MKCSPVTAALRFSLGLIGGYIAYKAAPDIEAKLFPIYVNEYVVPFDPARPDHLAEVQLDRVCWKVHIHKIRAVRTMRRSVAIVAPDGTRYFLSPLDARTGDFFASKDARPSNWEGDIGSCAYLPNALDTSNGFRIEPFGQYMPLHHLWLLDHEGPVIDVPPISGEQKQ